MAIVKYQCFACVVVTIIILWLTLHTTNNDYTSAYENIKQLQYRVLVSNFNNKFEVQRDTLVDLDEFKYLMNNVSMCMTSKATTGMDAHSSLVIMIHSARHNFDQRYAIRSTWGSIKTYRQWSLHLIFLLGIDPTSDPKSYAENRLWKESEEFGDMVMGNFVDSYKNLTYKHLMGYKWVSTFCPTAKYILKTDDDIFADIFQVIDVLLMELINSDKTFSCENMGGNKPDRANDSKWYAPETIFPDDMYPDFCSGSAYIVKAEDALKIYSISNKTNFFWIDDVFVTGILREKYDKIVNRGNGSSLQILTLYNKHYMGETKNITEWCSKDLTTERKERTEQFNFAFILLENEFVRDMLCIWNKVRLMRFKMHLGLDITNKDNQTN